MRKLMVALGALALAFGASAISVQPTGELGFAAAHAQGKPAAKKAAPKKAAAKKKAAPKKQVANYKRRCKAGQRWNAAATASTGACEKISKPKSKAKAKKSA